MSADQRSAGDRWMRAQAKPRGLIPAEPTTRAPTPSERMSAAMRAARDRTLRIVGKPGED